MLNKFHIHSAVELAEKQATRTYARFPDRCEQIHGESFRETRSGRRRFDLLGAEPLLRNDFFTTTLIHKENFNEIDFQRFKNKKIPDLRSLIIWVTKMRRRVKAIIKAYMKRRKKKRR